MQQCVNLVALWERVPPEAAGEGLRFQEKAEISTLLQAGALSFH
jgi:hypothetical protein